MSDTGVFLTILIMFFWLTILSIIKKGDGIPKEYLRQLARVADEVGKLRRDVTFHDGITNIIHESKKRTERKQTQKTIQYLPLARSNVFPRLPRSVRRALSVFSDEELSRISAFVSQDTGTLQGIGFMKDGELIKPDDPNKAYALTVIEEHYRIELETLHSMMKNSAIQQVDEKIAATVDKYSL